MAVASSTPPSGWLLEAANLLCAVAEAIAREALRQLLEDFQRGVRRRPELLLVATMVVGIAAGRALRTRWADGDAEEHEQEAQDADELDTAALDALLQRMWPG